MKIVIMCGGRGKRLGELSNERPKVLTELHGRPILDHKIQAYLNQGYNEFILCTGYKSDMVEENIQKYKNDCRITISNAGESAGILKRLVKASELFDGDAILTYGDTLTDLDLELLCEYHRKLDVEATIVTAPIQNPFGLVEFDANNKVTFFKEKPILKYYIGYAVISKSSFDLVSQKIIDYPDGAGLVTYFRILIAMEKLGAWHHAGFQITFNTQDELAEARRNSANFFTLTEH